MSVFWEKTHKNHFYVHQTHHKLQENPLRPIKIPATTKLKNTNMDIALSTLHDKKPKFGMVVAETHPQHVF